MTEARGLYDAFENLMVIMRPIKRQQIGKRSKTQLTGRSPLRRRRSALDCSAVWGGGGGGGEEEEEEEEEVDEEEEEKEQEQEKEEAFCREW